MASQIEFVGIYVREFWRFEQAAGIVVEVPTDDGTADTSVFLECRPDELLRDQEYRFIGTWGTARNGYGRPFSATSFVMIQPHTRQGIIQYLVRAGEGLRFGPVRAAAIYDEWGQQAVEKCRTSPGEVVEMLAGKRLKLEFAAAVNLAARLGQDKALEATTLEVLDLLTGRGFPRGTIREAINEWGAKAPAVIRRDPYKLMRFRGCGFKRCDAMWLELGLPPARLKRQAMAAWWAIKQDTDGNTWYPITVAMRGIENNIGGADVRTEKALRLARLGGKLAEVTTDGAAGPVVEGGNVRWVAERRAAENERELAEVVAEAMGEGVRWPE